jgi:hypothetical protein
VQSGVMALSHLVEAFCLRTGHRCIYPLYEAIDSFAAV